MKRRKSLAEALFFPPYCLLCGETLPFDTEEAFCEFCRGKWETEKRRVCPTCLLPAQSCRCPVITPNGDVFPGVRLAFYDPRAQRETSPAKELTLALKDRREPDAVSFLARELAGLILSHGLVTEDTVITYVPRRPAKVRLTGTDQAKELAFCTSALLSLPCVTAICHGKGVFRDQKALGTKERIKNAVLRYAPGSGIDGVRGRQVLLFDDIVTSGATLSACAGILLAAGARGVISVASAKTVSAVRKALPEDVDFSQ